MPSTIKQKLVQGNGYFMPRTNKQECKYEGVQMCQGSANNATRIPIAIKHLSGTCDEATWSVLVLQTHALK